MKERKKEGGKSKAGAEPAKFLLYSLLGKNDDAFKKGAILISLGKDFKLNSFGLIRLVKRLNY